MRVTSVKKHPYRLAVLVLIACLLVPSILLQTAQATTVNVLDGNVSITDSANSNKVSGGTVTITAKGGLFSKKTNNITITNETKEKAQLSFQYTADKASSFKIAGASAAASGSYSVELEAGASLSITLVSNSGLSNTTATLKLSNFELTVVKASSQVTFVFDTSLGAVSVAGAAISNGDKKDVSGDTGAELVATTKNGGVFLGWTDADGKILSTASTYKLKPADDMTVKAAFAKNGGTPWFAVGSAAEKTENCGLMGLDKLYYYTVGTTYLFDNLNAATAKAAADTTNKAVVLMNSGALSAGTYTIPSGVTLLIPFDSANTLYTKETQLVLVEDVYGKDPVKYANPTEFRTLTLAEGAHLVVNGAMSLSAKTICAQGGKLKGGAPYGNVSFVRTQNGSSITINNGGALYAYGYITGSGSVVANSGATIYECFQIEDCRGGSVMTDMENRVFPLSQYYVQNIEVPLTLYAGAKEYVFTSVYMSSSKFPAEAQFVGTSSGMFRLENGYLIKKYDGSKDRLIIEMYGDGNLSNISLDVGTTNVDSSKYDLGINSNISVIIGGTSKITINQNIVLLPGSLLEIGEQAELTLANGKSFYVYDQDQWGNFCYSAGNKQFAPVYYAPGRTYTRTAADLVDAKVIVKGTFDTSEGYLYTTSGGANIVGEGNGKVIIQAGTQTITHQLVQNTGYTEIPITPARLQNADGGYLQTGGENSVYQYDPECQHWYEGDVHTHTNNLLSNVSLGNDLDMYFSFTAENAGEGWIVVINSADDRQTFTFDEWETYNSESGYYVVFTGLAAKQMTDNISVTLYDAEGNPVDSWCDSIYQYALRIRSKHPSNTQLQNLIVDMLHYGAACQKAFGYNLTNMANKDIEASSNTYVFPTENTAPAGDTTYFAAGNLITTSNIQFALMPTAAFTSEMSATYSFTNHWNKLISNQLIAHAEGYYYIDRLVVADAKQMITVTVNGVEYHDSIENYCARMYANAEGNQKDVYLAFMRFSTSAKSYLEGAKVE